MTILKTCDIIISEFLIGDNYMKTKDMIMIALFTALISAGAFIKIPVPVCPFTLQFLFTTLAGVILGGKNGAISVALYLVIGLMGMPVFTSGGGVGYIFQPTFGYLIGFFFGTYITGKIANSGTPSFKRLLGACFAGLAVVYALGMAYYWVISKFYLGTPIGIFPLFLYCFVLAVPGDILLCILSAELGRRILPVTNKITA